MDPKKSVQQFVNESHDWRITFEGGDQRRAVTQMICHKCGKVRHIIEGHVEDWEFRDTINYPAYDPICKGA